MKGLVFTEFLEMVEQKFGYQTANEIVERATLASGGVYTAVGTYPHQEMMGLLSELKRVTGQDVHTLLQHYGSHLFGRFALLYPDFFNAQGDAFAFLESIENHIHRQVLSLYPDAELPKFETHRKSDAVLEMRYSSARRMSHFAYGLILGCLAHFNEEVIVEMQALNADETVVVFTLTRHHG